MARLGLVIIALVLFQTVTVHVSDAVSCGATLIISSISDALPRVENASGAVCDDYIELLLTGLRVVIVCAIVSVMYRIVFVLLNSRMCADSPSVQMTNGADTV